MSHRNALSEALFTEQASSMPPYDLLWGNAVDEVESIVSKHTLADWLGGLSLIDATLANSLSRERARFTERLESLLTWEQRTKLKRFRVRFPGASIYCKFTGLVAIQIVGVFGDIRPGDRAVTDKLLRDCIRLNHCVFEHLAKPHLDVDLNGVFGVVVALGERSMLPDAETCFRHCHAIWASQCYRLSDLATKGRDWFCRLVQQDTGFSLTEIIRGGLACSVHSIGKSSGVIDQHPCQFSWPENTTATWMRAGVELTRNWSASIENFQSKCRESQSKDSYLVTPRLDVVMSCPILRMGDEGQYWVLSSGCFARRLLMYPVELGDRVSKSMSRHYLGHIIHSLVDKVWGVVCKNDYQTLDTADQSQIADGILWYSRGLFVIECKSALTSDDFRFRCRDSQTAREGFMKYLEFGKAISQIDATTRQVIDGAIPTPKRSRLRVLGAVVVTLEEMPLSHILKQFWEKVLLRGVEVERGLVLVPAVITLRELLEMANRPGAQIAKLLEKKQRDSILRYESVLRVPSYRRLEYRECEFNRLMRREFFESLGVRMDTTSPAALSVES